MKLLREYLTVTILFVVFQPVGYAPRAVAATEPDVSATTSDPDPLECDHVATADTIKIYFCDDIDLFVNQLGFMVFEP